MALINEILLKTGIITELSQSGGKIEIQWFKGITFLDIVATYILPFLFLLGLSIYLKLRYNKRKLREEITLSNFLRP